MRINENILISSLTTMRLGGPARYVLEIERPDEVADAYGFARTYNIPTFALGAGANTIGHDDGFIGAIIINRMRGISEQTDTSGTTLKIMGGENWDTVVEYACNKNLTGIEALSKIPGLAGSAPVQNIGAYGQQISDVLESIDAYDIIKGIYCTLTKEDLEFSYRKSILNSTQRGRYFVISITIKLKEGQMPRPFYRSIEQYIEANDLKDYSPKGIREIVTKIRASKLPDPLTTASSGSFFKNIYLTESEAEVAEQKGYPVYKNDDGIKINSGWLIEEAGLKGELLHGIRVSDKAALVLINESATSFNDLAAARDEIIAKVYDHFGFWLEQEPVEIVNPSSPPIMTPGVTQ